jgi:hypothetical protein
MKLYVDRAVTEHKNTVHNNMFKIELEIITYKKSKCSGYLRVVLMDSYSITAQPPGDVVSLVRTLPNFYAIKK